MKITTKYTVGDTVYRKAPSYRDYREVSCELCVGTGEVTIAGAEDRKAKCPDCYGRGTRGVDFPVPSLAQELTIGQVNVMTRNKTDRGEKEVTYMCKETGVGSGTVHREEHLFESAEEALASGEKP